MKVGYLHISVAGSKSGVIRYSRLLASAARKQSHLEILETDIELTNNTTNNLKLLSQAAKKLSEANVVHIQFNKYTWGTWGEKWGPFQNIKAFINNCKAPILATIHDVFPSLYPPYGLLEAFQREYYQQRKYSNFQKLSLRSTINNLWNIYIPNTYTLRWFLKRVKLVITCTEAESQRLIPYTDSRKLVNIPHFIEDRDIKISSVQARSNLGLEKFKIITLQGFIFKTKGHRLLVEAIPKLPEDIKVVFAGGTAPNQEDFLQELLKLAEKTGVADRLLVTGYLSEKDLETYLMASHLAVCPFEILSASGSLSTWISLARRILASDLPQIAEYNRIEPGAIKTFQPYTAEAFAEAIKQELSMTETEDNPNNLLISLRKKLSISNIFDRHLKVYQSVVKKYEL